MRGGRSRVGLPTPTPDQLRLAAMALNFAEMRVPILVTALMTTSAIMLAIRPYSMLVAAVSSAANRATSFIIY